jgi:hypothetical protein
MRIRKLIRPLILAATVAVVQASTCSGDGSEEIETAVPWGSDTRRCKIVPSWYWTSMWPELTFEHDTTRHCPYTVLYSGSPLPFNLTFRVSPYGQSTYYVSASFVVRSNEGVQLASGGSYFQPGAPTGWQEAHLMTTYPGGYGTYPVQDTAVVVVYGGAHPPTYPGLTITLPGRVEYSPPDIAGATYVVANYPQSWGVVVSEEPLSYRYQWDMNGSALKGEKAQYVSLTLTEGEHTIGVTVTRSDGSTVYIDRLITAVDCGGPNIC